MVDRTSDNEVIQRCRTLPRAAYKLLGLRKTLHRRFGGLVKIDVDIMFETARVFNAPKGLLLNLNNRDKIKLAKIFRDLRMAQEHPKSKKRRKKI